MTDKMMKEMDVQARTAEADLYGFDRDLYDLADFVDDVALEHDESSLSRIASQLFIVQAQIEQAVDSAVELQSIIAEFENMKFAE